VVFYQLAGRQSAQFFDWNFRLLGTAYNVNRHVVPALVVLAALALLAWRWRALLPLERRLVAVAAAVVAVLPVWVATVAPHIYVRYVVAAAPIGALLAAWVLVRGPGVRAPALAWTGAVVVAGTTWLAAPLNPLIVTPTWHRTERGLRAEVPLLVTAVFGRRPDPNRLVVEWLRAHARPTDEILVNYEDVPLMFYLPNPIRGGIAAFRVEDPTTPPAFAVIRRSVAFVHWPVFQREIDRHAWEMVPLQAPDVVWGNNPDPIGQRQDMRRAPPLLIARRVGPRVP
jgi:hypothetical protein